MTPFDAFHHTVRRFPGGAAALAPRVGMSADILRNKSDVNKEHHKPTLQDVISVMGITGDFSTLKALANEFGFLLVKAPDANVHESDMSVLEQVVSLGVANGTYLQTVNAALADGKVDRQELKVVKDAQRILQTTAAEVTQRLEGMAE